MDDDDFPRKEERRSEGGGKLEGKEGNTTKNRNNVNIVFLFIRDSSIFQILEHCFNLYYYMCLFLSPAVSTRHFIKVIWSTNYREGVTGLAKVRTHYPWR